MKKPHGAHLGENPFLAMITRYPVTLAVALLLLAGSAAAQEVKTLGGHTGEVFSIAWSPDGTQLASGSLDRTVRIWDASTGSALRTLTGHTDRVRSVAWSPDGTKLASGSSDNTIRIWENSTGSTRRTLTGHADVVQSVAWSPNGSQLASGSKDETIRVWDSSTGSVLRTLNGHAGEVWSVAWSPDGTQLASGSGDNTIRIWDPSTGRTLRTFTGHTGPVVSIAWSPDGTQLASGSFDHTIRIWNSSTSSTLRTLTGHIDWVVSIAWSPDGTQLASGSLDRTVRIWDASTGSALRTLAGHTDWVFSIAWSPDGTQLASGSADFVVRIWDASAVPSLYPAIAVFSTPHIAAISSLLLVSLASLIAWRRRVVPAARKIQTTRAAPVSVSTGGRWTRGEALLLVALISASLALRLTLFPIPGFVVDLNYFATWHARAATNLSGFYNSGYSDYPPLNILIFSLIGHAEGAAGLLGTIAPPFDSTEALFLKLPQNLVDLAVPVLLYAWLRPKGSRVALLGAAAYAFNPATIFDLSVWGQWDSLYTVFMVASLMSVLKRRFELSGVLLALAVLAKPQGVLLLPVIAYVLLQEGGLKRTISSGLVAGVAVLAVITPFQGASNPVAFISERYLVGYNAHKLTSLDAYNFWALAGMYASDQTHVLGLSLQSWGWLGFLAVAGVLMWLLDKRYPNAYAKTEYRDQLFLQVAFLTVFAFFMLATRIHERYLFPALALLVMAWPRNRRFYFALTGSYLFNLAYALYHMNGGVYAIQDWTVPVFVGFNVMLFVWVLWQFWKGEPEPPRADPP